MSGAFVILAVGLIVMGALYGLAIRVLRRVAVRLADAPAHPGFDMAELNDMLAAGLISSDEFDRLQQLILAQRNRAIPLAQGPDRGFEVLPVDPPHKGDES